MTNDEPQSGTWRAVSTGEIRGAVSIDGPVVLRLPTPAEEEER